MRHKRRFVLLIAYIFFLLCLLPAAIYTYKHPSFNFDMLPYMALILRIDQKKSIEELHKQTYSIASHELPADEYKKLTETPPYRKKFEIDATEFGKILPNYIVKPFYLWSCWLFYKCGCSLPIATVLPSIISYLILGLFLFYWLSKYLQVLVAFSAGLLIMFSTVITSIARLSTPDILSALFLLLSFYFILEKRNIGLMFIFFILSILSRVDNIITCFFFISFLTFFKRWRSINIKQYFFLIATLAIIYICMMLPVRDFQWSIFYYPQYAAHIDYSKDFDQPVSFVSHFSLMYSKLMIAFVSTHFTLFAFLALLILNRKNISFRNLSLDESFVIVLASIGFFKFLLLPDLSDRFYIGFYLVIIILLIRKFYPQISMKGNENR